MNQHTVVLQSFGYKHTKPAGIVIDCRSLPNPFNVKSLADLDGRSWPVQDWLLKQPSFCSFVKDSVYKIVQQLISNNMVTISFGCMGGKHRSVAAVELVAPQLERMGYRVIRKHLQLEHMDPQQSTSKEGT